MKHVYTKTIAGCLALAFLLNSCRKEQGKQDSSPSANEQLVNTPFGWIPASHAHIVEAGTRLVLNGNEVLKVKSGTNSVIAKLGERQLFTAAQLEQRRSARGQAGLFPWRKGGGGNQTNYPADNWVTYSQWHNTSGIPITSFSTNWIVPNNPSTNHGQTLYIFNGMESDAMTDIIQPVLQWGTNPYGGGGNDWEIANWYVWQDAFGATQAAVQLPKIVVTPGTALQGVMNFNGNSADGSFIYTSSFTGYGNALQVIENAHPNTATANIAFIDQQTWMFETLEAYSGGANSNPPNFASDYPPDITINMTGINFQPAAAAAALNWTPVSNTTNNFGETTSIISNSAANGEVDIFFHPAPPPNPLINGQSYYYFSASQYYGSGNITAVPGTVVTVTAAGSGPPPGAYNVYCGISGASFTDGTTSISVSSTSQSKQFVMPASGSIGWGGSFSEPNSFGSGGISVY